MLVLLRGPPAPRPCLRLARLAATAAPGKRLISTRQVYFWESLPINLASWGAQNNRDGETEAGAALPGRGWGRYLSRLEGQDWGLGGRAPLATAAGGGTRAAPPRPGPPRPVAPG